MTEDRQKIEEFLKIEPATPQAVGVKLLVCERVMMAMLDWADELRKSACPFSKENYCPTCASVYGQADEIERRLAGVIE